MDKTFQSWLREQIKARGISQTTLAYRAGYESKTIESYIYGQRTPSRQGAVALAKVLEVPVNEVLGLLGFDPRFEDDPSGSASTDERVLDGETYEAFAYMAADIKRIADALEILVADVQARQADQNMQAYGRMHSMYFDIARRYGDDHELTAQYRQTLDRFAEKYLKED